MFSIRHFHRYEYHWADGTNIKKPIKCSAPKYIDYLMTWVQDQLDDETLFPSKIGIYFFIDTINSVPYENAVVLRNIVKHHSSNSHLASP